MSESKRLIQKEQTRNRLIETALIRFAEDGLLAARTSDIAEDAGVSHGTVFAHFPSRDDLLISVIEEFGRKITGRIHELAEGSSGIREVLKAHLNGLTEYETFYYRLVTEARLLPNEVRNTLVMIQSALSFHFYQAAAKELSAGKIRQVSMDLLFNTWIGLIHYYLGNRDWFAPGESVLKQHGERLLDYYIYLLTH